jgi:hypothetical protein
VERFKVFLKNTSGTVIKNLIKKYLKKVTKMIRNVKESGETENFNINKVTILPSFTILFFFDGRSCKVEAAKGVAFYIAPNTGFLVEEK